MKYVKKSFFSLVFLINPVLTPAIFAADQHPQSDCLNQRYTFSWSLEVACSLPPRGGTSAGIPVVLDSDPLPGWIRLQVPGQSDFEKDRQAILAMAGEYRTSFEFLETLGYTPGFQHSAPYQSWGTEVIYVIEDSGTFISLQHLMVMFIKTDENTVEGPFVQKHWRQDWHYEKTSVMEYSGHDTWQHRQLTPQDYSGQWSQSVFQVDDSPRYEAMGKWSHTNSFSSWTSGLTRRPLPRRESSIRSDYDVLEGYNTHTIIPTGWVHEEENWKLVLNDPEADENNTYLSKELGVNRYEAIIDFDFSEGEAYWNQTGKYWSQVREAWSELFTQSDSFSFSESVDGVPLFVALFRAAEAGTDDIAEIRSHIAPYLK